MHVGLTKGMFRETRSGCGNCLSRRWTCDGQIHLTTRHNRISNMNKYLLLLQFIWEQTFLETLKLLSIASKI